MPITKTSTTTQQTVETLYENRVLKTRKYNADRNHSDTLDYSDWRCVEVTEALVYVGRQKLKYDFMPASETNTIVDVPVEDRFKWVDCTNLFSWRNGVYFTAVVDDNAMIDPVLTTDYIAWNDWNEEQAKISASRARAHEEAQKKAREEEEKNRPVPGKKMTVVRGRKVPVGFTGTVAFVTREGGVLLKKDSEWRDRKAQGTWVNASYLKAV